MTTTYNPRHPAYFNPQDLRGELSRVYDICGGCRLCWNLCPSFNDLFNIIDTQHDGAATELTDQEHDQVVDGCFQCKLCYIKCPYIPPHEWQLDFPRLMLRASAYRWRRRGGTLVDQVLARTDLLGKLNSALAPLVNRMTGNPRSFMRRLMELTIGIAAKRLLPTYASQTFSTWFRRRGAAATSISNGSVALFQTCMVEYQNTGLGKDVVRVFEHNRIGCTVPGGTVCCGMPWLDVGNLDAFTEQARKNVAVLAAEVRAGKDVVVLQPTCGYVLKKECPDYLGSDDARLVGSHTYDATEYLMKVHREDGKGLDTTFPGAKPETITWQVPCHLRAQNIGFKSRDLMVLTGAKVTVVDRCAGIDGSWGLRAKNYEAAVKVALPMVNAVKRAGSQVVAGDCHLANGVITEETGRAPMHPIQVLARAYGFPEERSS